MAIFQGGVIRAGPNFGQPSAIEYQATAILPGQFIAEETNAPTQHLSIIDIHASNVNLIQEVLISAG